jgi:LPXTG-motif cell wall-anchored protein
MKKTALSLFLILFLMAGGVKAALAGPHLTLSPAAGNYTVGSEFKVTIGVDSGTEKSAAVDAWATFDAAKLEVVSIEKAASPAFAFAMGQNIRNSEGKFDISCTSTDMSSFETAAIVGDLAVVTFRAKAEGVASLNFSCASGSSIDTNIFNVSAVDVIDCASNQSGSYTISAGSSGTNPTATPTTASSTSTTTTTTSSELPQTGVVENTVGLVIFGLVSMMGALVLRWL